MQVIFSRCSAVITRGNCSASIYNFRLILSLMFGAATPLGYLKAQAGLVFPMMLMGLTAVDFVVPGCSWIPGHFLGSSYTIDIATLIKPAPVFSSDQFGEAVAPGDASHKPCSGRQAGNPKSAGSVSYSLIPL